MEDRIEALERVVVQLTGQVVAQGVVCRTVADLLARGGADLADVRDVAVAAAEDLNADVAVAVRVLLADAPAGAGAVQ